LVGVPGAHCSRTWPEAARLEARPIASPEQIVAAGGWKLLLCNHFGNHADYP